MFKRSQIGRSARLLWLGLTLLPGLAFGTAMPAGAADLAQPVPPLVEQQFDDRWSVKAAVYLWGAGLDGEMGFDGLGPTDVHASFGDILSNLNIAVMATGEVRYERISLYTDLVYTSLEASGTGPRGLLRLEATNENLVGTAMATYRAVEVDKSSLDLMAGARLWYVDTQLKLEGPNRVLAKRGATETWVDPMVGLRARIQGDSPLYVTAQGLIGGFQAGASIDGDLLGVIGYEVNNWFSLVAGYRAYGVDYEHDDFVYKAIQHGPLIAGVINF